MKAQAAPSLLWARAVIHRAAIQATIHKITPQEAPRYAAMKPEQPSIPPARVPAMLLRGIRPVTAGANANKGAVQG